MNVALMAREPEVSVIVLETAKAVKFDDTIKRAIGQPPARPDKYVGIEDLPQHVVIMTVDAEQVQKYIARHCTILGVGTVEQIAQFMKKMDFS